MNDVSSNTSTVPAIRKWPVVMAALTSRNSEMKSPKGGRPTSVRTPAAKRDPVHGMVSRRPDTPATSVVSYRRRIRPASRNVIAFANA